MYDGLVREGRTVSDMSNDGRFESRLGEVLLRLVHEPRELGNRNATHLINNLPFTGEEEQNKTSLTIHPSSNISSRDGTPTLM